MRLTTCMCGVLVLCASYASAVPTNPTTAAIFAGNDITFAGSSAVSGAPVIANGNIRHLGGVLTVDSMYGGGTFTHQSAAFQESSGNILFNGDIVDIGGPGSVFAGNITSGGSVSFVSSATVQGDVVAASNVNQPFSFATIQGNVAAGGDVHVAGTVAGNVTHGGTLTLGTWGTIGGTVTPGGPVAPPAYQPLTLPAGRNLAAGSNNVILSSAQDLTLSPGVYGRLQYASGNTVTLNSGQYVFAGIDSTFSLNSLSFDTSDGPIDIYVADNLTFDLVQVVNGQKLFAGHYPDPADSLDISIEVAGSLTARSSFYGTLLAPNGDITLDYFADVTGRVLAGHDVVLYNSDVTVVPEPATLSLLALATMVVLRRRRK